jgi:glycosyltransferase involved in cell wall biosynthesis
MRVLVINPALLRFDSLGACEQDRLAHIRDLTRLGHDVRLLTRASPHHTVERAQQYYLEAHFEAQVAPPPSQRWTLSRLRDLAFLDGAAWEYGSPDFLETINRALDTWQPQLVWCHGSYLWAAARFARHRVPTVIRSVNYEPNQLEERSSAAAYWVRYLGKQLGEQRATHSTVLAAITPDEQTLYQRINPRARVELLPLRTLPDLLKATPRPNASLPLRIFFMGASYNVPHNLAALEFVVTSLAPHLRASAPGTFEFHILGSKVPKKLLDYAAPDLIFAGYVPDLDAYLAQMDIALAPRLSGVGMQQKVFEPLCRGFPTITHPQALAGYAFEDGKQVLLGSTVSDYGAALFSLKDVARRRELGENALQRASELFSREVMDSRLQSILDTALAAS